MRHCIIAFVTMACAMTGIASAAGADDSIRPDCHPHVVSIERLSFAHAKHRLWYQRYWSGKCVGLSFLGDGCTESEPGWNEVITVLLPHAPSTRANELLATACKLGELVGYEWAKDNNVRCIHTNGQSSIRTLIEILRENRDVFDRLRRADAKAKSMCRSLQPPAASN